jgi:hypothetical protein
MAGISLLNAAFLTALVAVAVPVIIHLIFRRRARVVEFSSLMLLRLVELKVARRHRIREWLLLLLRMGVLLFLVLGLAKPLWRKSAGGEGVAVASLLLLDDSFSMAYSESGVERMAMAKEAAVKTVRSLQRGDEAAILTACRAKPGGVAWEGDPDRVVGELKGLRSGFGCADMMALLEQAYGGLAASTSGRKEIVIFSEFQAINWRNVRAIRDVRGFDPRVALFLVPIGSGNGKNITVETLELGREAAVAGCPFECSARIRNHAGEEIAGMLSLTVDGKKVADRSFVAPPAGFIEVRIPYRFDNPGFHEGSVHIDGDALEADNTRFFALDVTEGIGVLVVNGDPSRTPFLDETFYLMAALNPSGEKGKRISPLRPRVLRPEDLSKTDLSAYDVVILANVPAVPKRAIGRIRRFVRAGGGLLIFAGNKLDLGFYNDHLVQSLGGSAGLLPCRILPESKGPSAFHLGDLDGEHPAFRIFRDGTAGDFRTVRFSRRLAIEPLEGAAVPLRFADGHPALVDGIMGEGRVAVFAATCDMDWGNFPAKPVFLPFLHQAILHLAGGAKAETEYRVGQPFELALSRASGGTKGDGPVLIGPRGGTIRPTTETRESGGHGMDSVTFRPLHRPGIYRLRGFPADAPTGIAVNVQPEEGNLAPLGEDEIRANLLGAREIEFIRDRDRIREILLRSRRGRELWDYLFFLALLLLLLEIFVANRVLPQGSASAGTVEPVSERAAQNQREPVSEGV